MMKFLKTNAIYLLAGALIFAYAFSKQGQKLSAKEFAQKIKETKNAQIVDVRTPGEYSGGYIDNAVNIDWNSKDFKSGAKSLDKGKPVFVYCISGGRSSSAANELRSMGFDPVYELDGGMMSWRAFELPEVTSRKAKAAGMSLKDYELLLEDQRLVLIDFYAPWCAPCKRMTPYLDEMAKTLVSEVKIVKINADAHPGLPDQLQLSGVPTLFLYKNTKKVWSHIGYISKDELMKAMQKYR